MNKEKSFKNLKHNNLQLDFPNGNHLSTIWGVCTYSENHDYHEDKIPFGFSTFLGSNTVEIMFSCGEKLKKRILKKYNEGNSDPIGYLDIIKWLEIVNLLAKEIKK